MNLYYTTRPLVFQGISKVLHIHRKSVLDFWNILIVKAGLHLRTFLLATWKMGFWRTFLLVSIYTWRQLSDNILALGKGKKQKSCQHFCFWFGVVPIKNKKVANFFLCPQHNKKVVYKKVLKCKPGFREQGRNYRIIQELVWQESEKLGPWWDKRIRSITLKIHHRNVSKRWAKF